MFTVLGMELFSNTLRFNMDNEKIDPFGDGHGDVSKYFSIPDSNFNDFLSATLSVFIVLANDGWIAIFIDHYRASGISISIIFFISLVVLGQLILFNLFLAILLKEFDDTNDGEAT